jgi:hypothetical protein
VSAPTGQLSLPWAPATGSRSAAGPRSGPGEGNPQIQTPPAEPLRGDLEQRPAAAPASGPRVATPSAPHGSGVPAPPVAPAPGASPAAPGASPVPTAAAPPSTAARTPEELAARLAPQLPGRLLRLTLALRQRTILTFRRRPAGVELSLHRAVAAAPDAVLDAVATFVAAAPRSAERRRALAVLRQWFATVPAASPRRRRTLAPAPPRGAAHDLRAIRDRLVESYFAGELGHLPEIVWGAARPESACRRSRRRGGGSIRLGSYAAELDLIRIHPRLAGAEVPEWVVATVVFHELLHAAIPVRTSGGRRLVHPPELRARERAYPDHQRTERWIARHLPRLLRG